MGAASVIALSIAAPALAQSVSTVNQTNTGNAATDYLGGFARFCPADATAPSTPGSFSVASTGTSRKLTWTGSTDPGGGTVTYDVVRDGKVVAQTSAATLTYTDPSAPAGTTYTVRAVDVRGNRSASPAPKTVS